MTRLTGPKRYILRGKEFWLVKRRACPALVVGEWLKCLQRDRGLSNSNRVWVNTVDINTLRKDGEARSGVTLTNVIVDSARDSDRLVNGKVRDLLLAHRLVGQFLSEPVEWLRL